MGKIKTPHSSIRKALYKLSNRCVVCNTKIPLGDVHYDVDGKMYCGKCAYKKGEVNYGNCKEKH